MSPNVSQGIAASDVVMLDAIPQVDYPLYVADQPVTAALYYRLLDALTPGVRRLRMLHAGSRLVFPEACMEALAAAGAVVKRPDGYQVVDGPLLRRHSPAPPDSSRWMVTVNAAAGAVQVIAAEILGQQPSVTQGAWTELPVVGQALAEQIGAACRDAGYEATVSPGWGA